MRFLGGLRWRRLAIAAVVAAAVGVGVWRVWERVAWRRHMAEVGFAGEFSVPKAGDRVLIVAPHPDDETLGCGGLMQAASRAGAEVYVALMTNGDASELALIFDEKTLHLTPQGFIRLGFDRQKESLKAVGSLGVPSDHVYALGYPNGGLLSLWRAEHWLRNAPFTSMTTQVNASPYPNSYTPHALYCGAQLHADLVSLLRRIQPTHVFVTQPQDVHPDHWATAAFVSYALETLRVSGLDWAQRTQEYGCLIHWPRWPVPRALRLDAELLPPRNLQGTKARPWLDLILTGDQTRAKYAAIRMYHSEEPRFSGLMRSFARANEAFAVLNWRPLMPGDSQRWTDEVSGRRKLDGADILGAEVARDRNGISRARIWCAPQPLFKRAYLALDCRTWDKALNPVITTAYISGDGTAHGIRLTTRGLQPLSLTVTHPSLGEWTLGPVPLPEQAAGQPVLVGCWSNIPFTATDPAFPD